MKRVIKILYFLISSTAWGHAPIEHVPTADAVEQSEARKLIMAFRRTGDDEYLETAWRLMQPEIQTNASAESLLTYAILSQSRHQFELARDFINRAIAINPRNNEAHLLLASINLVVGEVEAARSACARLNNTSLLVAVSCYSRVALANNKANIAYPKLAKLLALTHVQHTPPTTLAWAESVAGDLAVQANLSAQAIIHYQRSLQLESQVQVKAALADVLFTNQQPDRVLELITHHETALPLLVRRLIALKAQPRRQQKDQTIVILDKAFTQWIAEEDWLHAREMSRFYLDVVDQPRLARRLALKNIETQKEPEDWRLLRRTSEGDNTADADPTISQAIWAKPWLPPGINTHPQTTEA